MSFSFPSPEVLSPAQGIPPDSIQAILDELLVLKDGHCPVDVLPQSYVMGVPNTLKVYPNTLRAVTAELFVRGWEFKVLKRDGSDEFEFVKLWPIYDPEPSDNARSRERPL